MEPIIIQLKNDREAVVRSRYWAMTRPRTRGADNVPPETVWALNFKHFNPEQRRPSTQATFEPPARMGVIHYFDLEVWADLEDCDGVGLVEGHAFDRRLVAQALNYAPNLKPTAIVRAGLRCQPGPEGEGQVLHLTIGSHAVAVMGLNDEAEGSPPSLPLVFEESGPSAVAAAPRRGRAPREPLRLDDPTGDDVAPDAPGAEAYLRGGR